MIEGSRVALNGSMKRLTFFNFFINFSCVIFNAILQFKRDNIAKNDFSIVFAEILYLAAFFR